MLIVLNNKRVLKRKISEFTKFKNANLEDLDSYTVSPMGVHWDTLNEDLSLKGLLKHELAFQEQFALV